jgi:hypothetical protein
VGREFSGFTVDFAGINTQLSLPLALLIKRGKDSSLIVENWEH